MCRAARGAPQQVDIVVVQDGEQPLARAFTVRPLIDMGQRPRQRLLHEIVGIGVGAH